MEAEKRVREDRFGGYVKKRLDEALDEIAWLRVLDNGTRRPPWIDINLNVLVGHCLREKTG